MNKKLCKICQVPVGSSINQLGLLEEDVDALIDSLINSRLQPVISVQIVGWNLTQSIWNLKILFDRVWNWVFQFFGNSEVVFF